MPMTAAAIFMCRIRCGKPGRKERAVLETGLGSCDLSGFVKHPPSNSNLKQPPHTRHRNYAGTTENSHSPMSGLAADERCIQREAPRRYTQPDSPTSCWL